MEEAFTALKDFTLESLGTFLDGLADEQTPLPHPEEASVVFGTVDMSKNRRSLILAFIPGSEDEEEDAGGIDGFATVSRLTVSFICTGKSQAVRIRQICRYSEAFRRMILSDCSLGSRVLDCTAGERTFFPDAGTAEGQSSVVEMEVAVTTDDDGDGLFK